MCKKVFQISKYYKNKKGSYPAFYSATNKDFKFQILKDGDIFFHFTFPKYLLDFTFPLSYSMSLQLSD